MLCAQDAATLSGTIVDPSNARVPDADVVLVDTQRGTVRQARTDSAGTYLFASLAPGEYTLEVIKQGFHKLKLERLHLNVRDRKSLELELELAPVESTVVTVTAGMQGISSDPSTGAAIDRGYAEHLPLNSRDVQSLVSMSPGVTSSGPGNQFNVNGLRSNTNYYTLDGVSADISVGGGGRGPAGSRGAAAGMGSGAESGMISLDALQEVRVQTSTSAAEFGRSPGAQISLTSRSGANTFHGAFYEYFRHEKFNANDWFANSTGYPRGKMRHNNFGGTFGGPLARNKTHFFASYERLRSLLPRTVISDVPDIGSREAAPPGLQPYLSAFPIPNRSQLEGGAAQFIAALSNRSTTDAASLRIDHMINDRLRVFARYRHAPSDRASRGFGFAAPNVLTDMDAKSHTFTSSLTWLPGPRTTNDLRVNVTTSSTNSASTMDGFGGAIPLTDELVFPPGITSPAGSFLLSVSGAGGYSYGTTFKEKQHQINIVDSISHISGNHALQFGVDVRRLAPTDFNRPYQASVMFNGLSGGSGGLLSGSATNAVIRSSLAAVYPVCLNFSTYTQDTWKATNRTTLTFGLRWDVNPAPDVRSGPPLIAMTGSGMFSSISRLDPLYKTRWGDVAPRLGFAYQMDTTPGRELILRTGAGLFYEVGYGAATGAFGGAPYVSQRTLTGPEFPLTPEDLVPPPLPATRPYGQISAADPYLQSPKVYQWNVTLERMFGFGQSLSVGYVRAKGRELLQMESRRSSQDSGNDSALRDFDVLRLTSNGATSDYHGLQVQFRRRLARDLMTQISYAYGHSIDSASSDPVMAGFATLLERERGNSDFDVRHNLSFSGSYNFPAPKSGLLAKVFGNWWTEWVVTARSALPFDIHGISATTSEEEGADPRRGLFAMVRPNYNGKPVWLDDPRAPGGRRLNPDAFELPDEYEQGNLGRNTIRGLNVLQADFSLRRQLVLTERVRLHIMAQAFNVLNKPNFMDPSPNEGANLASPNFGVATRMLNHSFGGFNSQYQTGGPRSVQFVLRLQF